MKGKKYSPEQIITKLRQAELMLAEGKSMDQVLRALEVARVTYNRWKRRYGNMQKSEVRKLKELEQENTRLKRIVADQALDLAVLKDFARGNF